MKAVAERVQDQAFMDLMYKALNVGYIFLDKYFTTELGTPQGSVVSPPLLCNILQNKLDQWLEAYVDSFNKGTRRKTNPEWRRLTRAGPLAEVHARNLGSRMANDPETKRMMFLRYADNHWIQDGHYVRDKLRSWRNN